MFISQSINQQVVAALVTTEESSSRASSKDGVKNMKM